MSDYNRTYITGGTFFFTVVTYLRHPIFEDEAAVNLLKICFHSVMIAHPFNIDAIVIMPDHLHTIWTLPDNEFDYSIRWNKIKGTFSRRYSGDKVIEVTESILKKREKGIWQRRFWEHSIRDQADYNKHCDYIHYNPVKHGLVHSPSDWKHSSFKKFVANGLYNDNWGKIVSEDFIKMDLE